MNYRIKELLKERNLTLAELAENIGVKSANLSLSLGEKGNPTMTTLEKIAKALDVPITELFEVSNSEKSMHCPNCGVKLKLEKEE